MPTTVLNPEAELMLDDIGPELASDATVQNVMAAVGLEVQRFLDTGAAFFNKLFPQNTDDTYSELSMWEELLGLASNPALTLVERLAIVQANVQERDVGSGLSWVELMTLALGTPSWTHAENSPSAYNLAITFPSRASGTPVATAVVALAKRVTPAHLLIIPTYAGGFLVGLSQLGVEGL